MYILVCAPAFQSRVRPEKTSTSVINGRFFLLSDWFLRQCVEAKTAEAMKRH